MLGGNLVGMLHPSETDIAPLATITATGSPNGGAVSALVDGNNSTYCSYQGTGASFIFDFGATKRNLCKLRLSVNAGTGSVWCKLCYSDDLGVTWLDTNLTSVTQPLGATITDYAVNDFGFHRHWGLLSSIGIQFTTVGMFPRLFF
jgi:hypothetical protein